MMYLKCPHCGNVQQYSELEYKRMFIRCKSCGKEFRQAECSPLTGGESSVRKQTPGRSQKDIASKLDEQMRRLSRDYTSGKKPQKEDPVDPLPEEKKSLWDRIRGKK